MNKDTKPYFNDSNFVNKRIAQSSFSLKINQGEKVCLVGQDKKAQLDFFYTICQENYIKSGTLEIGGKISFCDCNAEMILGGETVRQNIIFREEMDLDRYNAVVEACEVRFEDFSFGDLSILTKDGSNLSFVEIKKLLLARAIYQKADIYLIHNFFGYAEEEVEKNQFSKIVLGLLKHNTVIFEGSSDIIKHLSDQVLLLEGPSVKQINNSHTDTPQTRKAALKDYINSNQITKGDIFRSNINTAYLARTHSFDRSKHGKKTDDLQKVIFARIHAKKQRRELLAKINNTSHKPIDFSNNKELMHEKFNEVIHTLSTKLKKKMGWNEAEVYHKMTTKMLRYVLMQGKFWFSVEVLSFFLPVLFALFIDFWLGAMSGGLYGISEEQYFFSYLGLSIFLTICNYLRDVWFFKKMQLNAQAVHDKLVNKILNMKTHWVDLYPNSSIGFKSF